VPQNIELKVACTAEEFAAVRARLGERSLNSPETFQHGDSYFRVASGRLKLRVIDSSFGTTAELIQYHREDRTGGRVSTYRRIPVSPGSAAELNAALGDALGVLVTVRKTRTVAVWRSTRIHLDDVEGLGPFVELETVLGGELTPAAGEWEFQNVVDWLGLARLTSIPGSYSDLMLKKGRNS
jgi:adenylate cyclase class IV